MVLQHISCLVQSQLFSDISKRDMSKEDIFLRNLVETKPELKESEYCDDHVALLSFFFTLKFQKCTYLKTD